MGKRSLGYQLCETVTLAFRLNLDKHSIKRDPNVNKMDFVFSFN